MHACRNIHIPRVVIQQERVADSTVGILRHQNSHVCNHLLFIQFNQPIRSCHYLQIPLKKHERLRIL